MAAVPACAAPEKQGQKLGHELGRPLALSEHMGWNDLGRRYVVEPWRAADVCAEREARRRRKSDRAPDWRPLGFIILAGAILIALRYAGNSRVFTELAREWAADDPEWRRIVNSPQVDYYAHLWWAGFRVVGYFVIPAFFVHFVLREPLLDHGLGTGQTKEHGHLYVLATLVVLACVVVVSFDAEFQRKYPLYELAGETWRDFIAWEAMYVAQFFALEFFFRGVWIRTLERVAGGHAVTTMLVPYCMIHFGKPWLEASAAIVAGLFLGVLALRSRSIWAGFGVHATIGVSMDVAALLQTTGLPKQW